MCAGVTPRRRLLAQSESALVHNSEGAPPQMRPQLAGCGLTSLKTVHCAFAILQPVKGSIAGLRVRPPNITTVPPSTSRENEPRGENMPSEPAGMSLTKPEVEFDTIAEAASIAKTTLDHLAFGVPGESRPPTA